MIFCGERILVGHRGDTVWEERSEVERSCGEGKGQGAGQGSSISE